MRNDTGIFEIQVEIEIEIDIDIEAVHKMLKIANL